MRACWRVTVTRLPTGRFERLDARRLLLPLRRVDIGIFFLLIDPPISATVAKLVTIYTSVLQRGSGYDRHRMGFLFLICFAIRNACLVWKAPGDPRFVTSLTHASIASFLVKPMSEKLIDTQRHPWKNLYTLT